MRVLATSVFVIGQDICDLQLELTHQLAEAGIAGVHLCCGRGRIPRRYRNFESGTSGEALNPRFKVVDGISKIPEMRISVV
jgi:hypothetical protein